MEKKLRWGIISTADIGIKAVMPAIQQSATGVLAAVASRNLDKSEAVRAQFGMDKAYGTYEELLADPEIDAVYIPLPNHLHREWAIKAMEAGKHVLCEKPLALNAAEASEMAQTSVRTGMVLAEAFMYRHHPRLDRVRELIEQGEIGEIRGIRSVFTFNNPDITNIRAKREYGGGGLYDVGCYPLSAARLILGAEPVAATVQAQFSDAHDGVDMMASGLVEFPGGVGLTFDCGMWAEGREFLEILGSRGRIEVPHTFTAGEKNTAFTVYKDGTSREERPEGVNSYVLEVDDVAAAVFGLRQPRFEAEDAVHNMRLIDACLQSARERRRVEL
ncbi:Gfo/Idh/MocA family protein [Paenibacillus sp. J22TS3]|uniref:Gfo/Idh/MocA family protein n=1 Tax=Paenibacillus sp. J22TS3 TaxID=2807192 RepID=UPI001B1E1A87|nr:Gfo/Idh/MocA family oxidoreductase [Paenibacillus sp. J22TS3]GIP21973.1 deoxyfructose oxidoreductase [Paenibacillus sp. J22TS3]